ncbi:peptidase propeptide and ypeb domain-containing protein [Latilactobacillus graminis DSM 20719]|uniref:Peptidase propeptide and ypeb domain-containing protein n=1 Tax=Latilactobacillus graminis DSM 20719 TaxID=1423752 RepID=A0AA89L3V4_9LACO|nr:peptidase propeptide and ypeb domain-containing protein [Latilactobacillus graminis DSM 20719]
MVIIGSMWFIYHQARNPAATAETRAINIAQKYAKLQHPDGFYTYHRNATYYTVSGKDVDNHGIFVLINEKGNHATVYRQSSGISKNDALEKTWSTKKPQKVLNINFGLYQSKPVWEIVYRSVKGRLCYLTLDFKTGNTIQLIENI